jgi:thioredoxin 1
MKRMIFHPLHLLNMNTSEFQQRILETNKPLVVDFWASWCAPCRMTKPILEKLADEYADKVEFMPVNADDSRAILEQFKIIGIPTVMAFHGGEVASRVTGVQSEANYRVMFEALAEGKEVRIPISPFDRMLRLGAGALLALIGFSTSNWLVLGIGGIVAFLGVYDRCPIWKAVTGLLQKN